MKHRANSTHTASGRSLNSGTPRAVSVLTAALLATTGIATAADFFSEREHLDDPFFAVTASTLEATAEPGEPSHGGISGVGRSVWWQWTAPESGPFRLETRGSDYDTVLAVYTGSTLGSLELKASNDDAGLSPYSLVTFEAVAGQTYQIAVDGFSGEGGSLSLSGQLVGRGFVYIDDLSTIAMKDGDLLTDSDWQSLGSSSAGGIIVEGERVRGFLGQDPDGAATSSLWLPVNLEGREDSLKWVAIESELSVVSTQDSDATKYHLLVFSEEGDLLAGMEFDPLTQSVFRLDGVERHTTGQVFFRNMEYQLTIGIDRKANVWSAWMGTAPIFEKAVFSGTDSSGAVIGSVCIARCTPPGAIDSGSLISFAEVSLREVDAIVPRDNPAAKSNTDPFGGVPHAIPGTVEAEDYDEGGEGVGYHDTDAENKGGAYRPGGVDIVAAKGRHQIGYFSAGEWMSYTVEVEREARFQIGVMAATKGLGGVIRVDIDGVDASGELQIPDTASWTSFEPVAFETVLSAGEHVVTVVAVTNSAVNTWVVGDIDAIQFQLLEVLEPEPQPEPQPEPEPEPEPQPKPQPEPEPEPEPEPASNEPYDGVVHQLPGWIEAELYDLGGEGVAYSDTTEANEGGAFRNDAVDIISGFYGHHISYFKAGEWMEYTVNFAESGLYEFRIRVASNSEGGTFGVKIDDVDISGALKVPDTGAWSSWTEVNFVAEVSQGTHVMRIEGLAESAANGGTIGDIDLIEVVAYTEPIVPVPLPPVEPPKAPDHVPFTGSALSVPGRVEAEMFDQGGEGIAYSDTDAVNSGGGFRTEGVDISPNADGHHVGWFRADEWLKYSIKVEETARYLVSVRVTSVFDGGEFSIGLDDRNLSGTISMPNTGNWDIWKTISFEANIEAGEYTLSLNGLTNGAGDAYVIGDIDWIAFEPVELPEGPATVVPNPNPVGPPSPDDPVDPDKPIASFPTPLPTDDKEPLPIVPPLLDEVESLSHAVFQDRVGLAWKPSENAERYEIYRSTSGSFETAERVGVSFSPTFDDINTEAGAQYTYWVMSFSEEDDIVSTGSFTAAVGVELPSLVNISTRSNVRPGGPMIAGFVIEGDEPREVLVRAIGPSLGSFGVVSVASQPSFSLYEEGGHTPIVQVASGWDLGDSAQTIENASSSAGAFALSPGAADAALVTELAPGAYTAVVSDGNGGSGVCLVEVYMLDGAVSVENTELVNISTRGHVGHGADALIAGVVVRGDNPKRILVRGLGPALASFGVQGAVEDPVVRVFAAGGETPIAENDDWNSDVHVASAQAATGAFSFEPGAKDAGLVVDLDPGEYTVVLEPASGNAGVGLVEIFEVP